MTVEVVIVIKIKLQIKIIMIEVVNIILKVIVVVILKKWINNTIIRAVSNGATLFHFIWFILIHNSFKNAKNGALFKRALDAVLRSN